MGGLFFYTLIVSTFAQSWGTWHYSSNRILGIYIVNFPIEDLIFAILVSIAISSGVLVFIYYKQKNKFYKIYQRLRGNV